MRYQKPQWQEIEEFDSVVKTLVVNEPKRYGKVKPQLIIAYGLVVPEKDFGERGYQITNEVPPELYTTSREFFVKMSFGRWRMMGDGEKVEFVRKILDCIVTWRQ